MLSTATVSTHCARQAGGVEWVGKVLGFMRHFSIPKFHNAHGVDALAFVDNHVLSDPEIALSHDPADRKPRWPARMMTTKRLQVTPTANYLACLWILAHDVNVVHFMYGHFTARRRR